MSADNHQLYPYLLRGVNVIRPNQVWSTDITYTRLARGFVYLVAVIDWHSRKVLSWQLSLIRSHWSSRSINRSLAKKTYD